MPDPPSHQRLAIVIALILCAHQIIHALTVLQLPATIRQALTWDPTWQIILALAWGIAWGTVALRLVRRQRHALRYMLWLLLAFCAYSLIRLASAAQADYDRGRIVFLLMLAGAGAIAGLVVAGLVRWSGSKTREVFSYDDQQQDGDTAS